MDSKNEEEYEEEAILYLMALDDDVNEEYDYNSSCSSDEDEINDLFNEFVIDQLKIRKN